jgi:hypothetical protein
MIESDEKLTFPRVHHQTKFYKDGCLACRVQWNLTNAKYGYVEYTKFGSGYGHVEKVNRGTRAATREYYINLRTKLSKYFDK